MQTRSCALLVVLAACGGDDSSATVDALPSAPPMITVSGTATSRGLAGSSPEAGVLVAAYNNSDENMPVAMATSDASGNYSLTITTGGISLDGYLKATKSGFLETYLYPPAPLSADYATASINMINPGSYGALFSLTQVQEQSGTAVIAMIVNDGTNPVAGATVTSSPAGTYRYNGSNGLPANMNTTSTQADGIGYILNVPAGAVTVNGMKTGMTFKSHPVKARAGQLTTTLVVP